MTLYYAQTKSWTLQSRCDCYLASTFRPGVVVLVTGSGWKQGKLIEERINDIPYDSVFVLSSDCVEWVTLGWSFLLFYIIVVVIILFYFFFSKERHHCVCQLPLASFSLVAQSNISSSSEMSQGGGGAQGNIWKKGDILGFETKCKKQQVHKGHFG